MFLNYFLGTMEKNYGFVSVNFFHDFPSLNLLLSAKSEWFSGTTKNNSIMAMNLCLKINYELA